ncbi:MAG: BrnA antitoxin family protein [Patescibacteria group bacterium]|nr:BrnA antitoxin family protein [Patescibacteria group bacterium]
MLNNTKKTKFKKLPKFKNEDEERIFWAKHDSCDYIDWSKGMANSDFPNLKPSTKTISLRLPLSMLDQLKAAANKKDIPYQSFIKVILDERLKLEKY